MWSKYQLKLSVSELHRRTEKAWNDLRLAAWSCGYEDARGYTLIDYSDRTSERYRNALDTWYAYKMRLEAAEKTLKFFHEGRQHTWRKLGRLF